MTDNATSRSLIDQLPLSLDFQDMGGLEKTGPVARIGTLADTTPIEDQTGDFTATIALAD